MQEIVEKLLNSKDADLLQLVAAPEVMQDVLPMDSSAKDLEVDVSLSFLNSNVREALTSGHRQCKKSQRQSTASTSSKARLASPRAC